MKGAKSLALAALVQFVVASSPPVKVWLKSSWRAPNLLLEVIESMSQEDPDTFFPLLDLLTSPSAFPQPLVSLTSEAIRQASIELAANSGYFTQPASLPAFELSLALHAASPKIQAFHNFYNTHYRSKVLPEDCGSWIDWYGHSVCTAEELVRLVSTDTLEPSKAGSAPSHPKILPFDHIYPPPAITLQTASHTAILYANLTSPNFRTLHDHLLDLASTNKVQYILRYIPPLSSAVKGEPNILAGYGVGLDLKKTDYLVVDDRRRSQGNGNEESVSETTTEEIDYIAEMLAGDSDLSTPLSAAEIKEIGINAIQVIKNSSSPLHALEQLSQNFPRYTSMLARRVTVNQDMADELGSNAIKIPGGANVAWLNGMVLTEQEMNPFSLLSILRKERKIMTSLTSLGLTAAQAVELVSHPLIGKTQTQKDAVEGLFDASDRPEGGDVIMWWNNVETDERYQAWPKSLHNLLRPLYPGQFPNIGRNLFNIVLVLDLSKKSSLAFLTNQMSNIITRNFPFTWGVAPIVETPEAAKAARLIYHMTEFWGLQEALGLMRSLAGSAGLTMDFELAEALFKHMVINNPSEDGKVFDFQAIVSGTDGPDDRVKHARIYTERLATTVPSIYGHAFINGKHHELGDGFLTNLQAEVGAQLNYLQEQMYLGKLKDDEDLNMGTFFYDLSSTTSRRNRYVFPVAGSATEGLRVINVPDACSRLGFSYCPLCYVYPRQNDDPTPATVWVVGDIDSPETKELFREAVGAVAQYGQLRASFIHAPKEMPTAETISQLPQTSALLIHLIKSHELYRMSPADIIAALGEISFQDSSTQARLGSDSHLAKVLANGGANKLDILEYKKLARSGMLLARELGFKPGEQGLIINGRIIGPIAPNGFLTPDFTSLLSLELSKRIDPVLDALNEMEFPRVSRQKYSHIIGLATSVLSAINIPDPKDEGLLQQPQRARSRPYLQLDGDLTSFQFGDNSTALFQFGFVLDPVSEIAQKWSSILKWLSTVDSVYTTTYLNPNLHEETLQLKRFYRYNIPERLSFNEDGSEAPATVEFNNLLEDPIYTLSMDVSNSWLVRPRESRHDLDNIHLKALSSSERIIGVQAAFRLDHIVVEGHARDTYTKQPPRGLQLQLTTNSGTPIADTQVVANLGYLQFKAYPGVFKLEIRPGRGRQIYETESVGNEGWNSPEVTEVGNEITVTSFEGATIYPRFLRLAGMENADVLVTPPPKGVFPILKQKITSLFPQKQASGQADINIFTVASGLLYERFASIMILSVMRNTKSSVKFWFIENFLSPSFLEFIPHLAKEYGFQYELVTYKWPSWLRAQKEKQRIIWGYKILFLDVLFPMDLKKVIFVDADQIVRADLKELVDLDLEGAPYGYTPMGDDNDAMEGFRFWKTGYWRDYLRGKPYHISALYVIDLVRFRQLAAGDRLRGQYQGLSQDPNSLANLDQDLPNHLQHEVPIFSLDKDWLWCETWCSKDRLDQAKTIDLCQNPLTKEPKLARARQIPEWEKYDAEIANLAKDLADKGLIQSHATAADVNALAGVMAGEALQTSPQADKEEANVDRIKDEL